MLQKTRGLVLRFTRFKETSIIVTIFTEAFGTHAYIINNIRSQKSTAIALYQPLTLLDLVVYHKPNQSIARIKEVKCLYAYQSFSTDMRKSSIVMFLCEVLNKCLKEEGHSKELFDFFQEAFITLDHLQEGVENFHLIFLLKLSRYLGFGANRADEIFIESLMTKTESVFVESLLNADYTTALAFNYTKRRQVLDELLRLYATHIDSFGTLNSVEVVRELLT